MKTTSRVRMFRVALAIAVAGVSAVGFSGCVAVAVGAGAAGAVAWYKGELKANLTQGVGAVNRATSRAADQLKLFKISEKTDETSGLFNLRNAKDEKVTIVVEKGGDAVTVLRVRVGVFGDEVLSRSILDQIKSNL